MEILIGIIVIIFIITHFSGDREYKKIRNKLLKAGNYSVGTCHRCGARADVTMSIGTYYIDCTFNPGYDIPIKLYCVNCGNARMFDAERKLPQSITSDIKNKAMMYGMKFRGISF